MELLTRRKTRRAVYSDYNDKNSKRKERKEGGEEAFFEKSAIPFRFSAGSIVFFTLFTEKWVKWRGDKRKFSIYNGI